MAVKNCPVCGRIFNDMGVNEVCVDCYAENEAVFRTVRDYLYDNPNQNIVQVSEATGVSIEKIKLFLRSERLIAVNNHSTALLGCQRCSKPIQNGMYCDDCRREIDAEGRRQLNTAANSSNRSSRMHTRQTGRR